MPSLEASLRNFAKARANWRPPRPWRSASESRVIKRLVWQWFDSKDPRKWSGRAVARWLGVTHTYVQKLVHQFAIDPTKMRRECSSHNPATLERLNAARDETRKEKECGRLRSPHRWRRAEFTVGDHVLRTFVLTKAEERRQAAKAKGALPGPAYVPPDVLPMWARGLPYYSNWNPCDPLVAIYAAMREGRQSRPRFSRRWRLGRPFRA